MGFSVDRAWSDCSTVSTEEIGSERNEFDFQDDEEEEDWVSLGIWRSGRERPGGIVAMQGLPGGTWDG